MMSDVFQSGQHPDADQLSAFAEQALPAHEQEATLAHLAICAECRAVIALSLPPEQVAKPAEKPARRAWFRGWNLAWSSAAAVAALALVLVYIHHASVARSRPDKHAEIAVAPPPAPIAPLPQKQASPSGSRNAMQAREENAPRAVNGNAGALNGPQEAPRGARPTARMQPKAGGGGGGGSKSSIGEDVLKQSFTEAEGRDRNAPSPGAKEKAKMLAPPATENHLAANKRRDQDHGAFATAGSGFSVNKASGRAALDAASSGQPLPSGLPILSIAEHGRQMLALDTAHALFLSEDAGGHWRAVAAPWKARAVTVSLVTPPARAAARTGNGFSAGLGAGIGGGVGASTDNLQTAEGNASITGTVTDSSGAVIPGASVTVSRTSDRLSHTAGTDSKGRYTVAGLTPGTYDVEARALGFENTHVSGVTVSPSRQNVANFKMAVGAASETVTVAASRADEIPLQTPSQAAPPESAPASPTVAAPPVFEITTEDGARWTSADGVTWKLE